MGGNNPDNKPNKCYNSGIVGRAYMKCVVEKNPKNATKKTEMYLIIIQQKVPVNGRLRADGLARSSKHAFEFLLLYILRCTCLYVPHPEGNASAGNDDNVVLVGWIIKIWLVDSDILHYSIGKACRERGFACMTNLSFEVGRQPDRHIRRWSLNLQAKPASRKISTLRKR